MKFILYLFLFLCVLSACKKDAPNNQQVSNLSAQIEALLKRTDSLYGSVSFSAASLTEFSKTIDSLNNQLQLVRIQVNGLKTELQSENANVDFLTKKLNSLLQQYEILLNTINTLFFKISNKSSTLSIGLEVYYPMDNNVNDISGHGFNGTNYGATLIKDRYDRPNSAYLFNGKSDFIQTNYPGILGGANRALSFWAKLDPVDIKSFSGMSAVSWGPATDGHRFDGYFNFSAIGPTSNIGASAITYKTISNINDNTWHHYVYMINAIDPKVKDIKIYQDGYLLETILDTYDLTLKVNTKEGAPLKIGKCSVPNDPSYFKGAIDEVRVYSRALSISEIRYLAAD